MRRVGFSYPNSSFENRIPETWLSGAGQGSHQRPSIDLINDNQHQNSDSEFYTSDHRIVRACKQVPAFAIVFIFVWWKGVTFSSGKSRIIFYPT